MVKNVIEPMVAEALAERKLSGFKFDRIILGDISPRLGGIKVCLSWLRIIRPAPIFMHRRGSFF